MNEVIEKQHEGEVVGVSEITQEEEIAQFLAVIKRAEICIWDIGKLASEAFYRRKIIENPEKTTGYKIPPGGILTIKELCEVVNLKFTHFYDASRVYRIFKCDKYSLPFTFYRAVLPLIKEQGEEAGRQMLLNAQKGERFEGEFEEYGYRSPWKRDDLERAVKIARGLLIADAPVPQNLTAAQNKSITTLKEVLGTELSKRKAAELSKKVEREIKATYEDLKNNFHDELDKRYKKGIAEKFSEAEQELVEQRAWIAEKMAIIEAFEQDLMDCQKPINALMTEKEFNKLRSFTHPDKNIGNEKKAQEVSLIVQKLGKSFNPKALTKKDLEIQGWKK